MENSWKIESFRRAFHHIIVESGDEFRWQHIFTLRRSQPYG
jgi:hypothetical protein